MPETFDILLARLANADSALQALPPTAASLETFGELLARRAALVQCARDWLETHRGTANAEQLRRLEDSHAAGHQAFRNLLVTRYSIAAEFAAAGRERRFADSLAGAESLGINLQG